MSTAVPPSDSGTSSSTPAGVPFRQIRPASQGERNQQPPQAKKRKITAVACQACQKKRCKCDGRRPRCSACDAAGKTSDCVYETRGNQSRSEALKERNKELETELKRLKKLANEPGRDSSEQYSALSAQNEEEDDTNNLDYDDMPQSATDTSFQTRPGPASIQPSYTGVTDVAMREDPEHKAFSSSMSDDNTRDRSDPRLQGKEENMSMGKVMFLEAEVKRLRGALEKAAAEGAPSIDGVKGRGNTSVPPSSRGGDNDPIYLSQRPLKAQSQLSGNAGSLIDSSGNPINPRDTTAFMRHGMSDVAFTPSPLAGADVPLSSTEAFTPYGVLPQSLGTMTNPQALPRASWDSPGRSKTYAYRPGPSRGSIEVYGNLATEFGNLPLSSSILLNHQQSAVQQSQVNNLRLPIHLIQMLNRDENHPESYDYTSPEFASSTVHSFRAFDRSLIAGGQSPEDVLGGPEIDVRPFFQKGSYDVHRHTPSTFGPWFVEAYPSMALPTRVAAAMLVAALLRWQIYPTVENYHAMPPWLRATRVQMFVPHMSAYDFVPWPEIRDILIDARASSRPSTAGPGFSEREVLFGLLSNLHLEWPHSNNDVFDWRPVSDPNKFGSGTTRGGGSGSYSGGGGGTGGSGTQETSAGEGGTTSGGYEAVGVSERFANHVKDLDNWALNRRVLERYPFLEGKARFVDLRGDGRH